METYYINVTEEEYKEIMEERYKNPGQHSIRLQGPVLFNVTPTHYSIRFANDPRTVYIVHHKEPSMPTQELTLAEVKDFINKKLVRTISYHSKYLFVFTIEGDSILYYVKKEEKDTVHPLGSNFITRIQKLESQQVELFESRDGHRESLSRHESSTLALQEKITVIDTTVRNLHTSLYGMNERLKNLEKHDNPASQAILDLATRLYRVEDKLASFTTFLPHR